jgi:hypothetical protein
MHARLPHASLAFPGSPAPLPALSHGLVEDLRTMLENLRMDQGDVDPTGSAAADQLLARMEAVAVRPCGLGVAHGNDACRIPEVGAVRCRTTPPPIDPEPES